MQPAVARASRTVETQVRKWGAPMTLRRTVITSISASGAGTQGAPLTSPAFGVFLPLSAYTDNREEQKSLAQKQLRYLAFSARNMTLVPRPHDNVLVGSDTYMVESSTPLNPSGDVIAYQSLVVKL